MPPTHGRVHQSSSQHTNIIDVDALAMQVVDVDQVYMKYEDDEDEIEAIDSKAFRESVRRNREQGKDRPTQQAVRYATPISAQNRVGTVEPRSSIGPAIQSMRAQQMQKRALSNPQEPAVAISSNKRRKIDNSRSPSIVFPSPSSASKVLMTPTPGPSNSIRKAPSPEVAQRNPPGVSFVDFAPRPAVPRTQNSNLSMHVGNNRVNNANKFKQPVKRVSEVIELSSDGEEVIELLTPKKKKQKRSNSPISTVIAGISIQSNELPIETESDDECDWGPTGMDQSDLAKWKPISINKNRLEDSVDDLVLEDHHIDKTLSSPLPRYHHPDTSKWVAKSPDQDIEFIWGKLGKCLNLNFRPPRQPSTFPTSYMRPFRLDFYLHSLKPIRSFKEAPGPINRVEQKAGWTVIASACDGGGPDEENEQPSAYNRHGSLATWCNGLDIPEGHRLKKSAYRDGWKHYAVHDVKFDPNREAFVSSGADRRTRFWTLSEETEDADPNSLQGQSPGKSRWKQIQLDTYSRPPHELVFQQKASILAVAEKKVHIYNISDDTLEHSCIFQLHPSKAPHLIGAMAWGVQSTENHLFVSSEPLPPVLPNPPIFEGLHKVYDVARQLPLYSLDATEAGDTIAVDPTGAMLGLSTRAPENRHILRLYDVSRREHKAVAKINLEAFPTHLEGEVNCATFSPDGLFIALARNDNQAHVYDVRMPDRGPLYRYKHFGESKAPSPDCAFGVVKAQWLHSAQTRRMALVTAGEDGCVRLWNPLTSSEDAANGASVAEVNSDIGHFSLGDPFAGEHQLVVGDCAGEVHILDNVVI